MNTKILAFFAGGLAAISMPASAQTYNVDIVMTGIKATPTDFKGSFTFNSNAACGASAVFCSGSSPQLTNIDIKDPLMVDYPGWPSASSPSTPGAFTAGFASPGEVSFIDTYLGTAPSSSFNYSLDIAYTGTLGGATNSFNIVGVSFVTDPNVTGIYTCGQMPNYVPMPGSNIGCSTRTMKMAVASAPEIDPASLASGLTLLFGGLAVLRGRRQT